MQDSHQQNQKKSTGRWTKEEHQRFMYAIMQYGKDWRKVQQYVKSRSGSQVRSHAQKFFNKLQKGTNISQQQSNRRNQQHSETEFDIQRQLNNQQTPSTPLELISLIKRQSKEQGGMIRLSQFKKTLQQHQQNRQRQPKPQESILGKANSFKSMSNILSVYQQVNQKEDTEQNQSFFISITKKYKRMFKQVEDFDKLIDLHTNNAAPKEQFKRNRKRSFTLLDANNLSEEQLDVKIQNIKKKIHPDDQKKQQKRQRRQSESSIQFTLPPLNKLTTIQEQPQEEFISIRVVAPIEDIEQKFQLDK